jgi:hypothetical protein
MQHGEVEYRMARFDRCTGIGFSHRQTVGKTQRQLVPTAKHGKLHSPDLNQ